MTKKVADRICELVGEVHKFADNEDGGNFI